MAITATPVQLLENIRKRIDTADKSLSLAKNEFDSAWYATLFTTVLKGDSFTIRWADGKAILSEPNQIKISGAATLLDVENLNLDLTITAQEKGLAMSFSGSFPETWQLGRSFSWLNSSMLSEFKLVDPGFLIEATESGITIHLNAQVDVPKAMQLRITINPATPAAEVAWTFTDAISLPGLDSVSVSDIRGDLNWNQETDLSGLFSATLKVGSFTLPVQIPMPGTSDELIVQWEPKSGAVTLPSVSEIKGLVGDGLFSAAVTPIDYVVKQTGIGLKTLELAVNNDLFLPTRIELQLSLGSEWKLIEAVSLKDPELAISIRRPKTNEDVVFHEIDAGGILSIGKTDLSIRAALPGQVFCCQLMAGETISFNDLLAHFGFNVQEFPAIVLTDLDISVDLPARQLTSAAVLQTELGFQIGGKSIALTEAGLDMTVSADGISGTLFGKLSVAGAVFQLSASKADSSAGWTFNGQSTDSIALSTGVSELIESTGISLPDQLPDINVSDLSFSYQPASKNYTLDGTLESDWTIDIGISSISLTRLSVSLSKSGSKTEGVISGHATIAGVATDVSYDLTRGLVIEGHLPRVALDKLIESFCESGVLGGLAVPISLPDIEFTDGVILLDVSRKSCQLSGNIAGYTKAAFFIEKADAKWGFAFAAAADQDFRFSKIDKSLSVLDGLGFTNLALVISSFSDQALKFPESFSLPDSSVSKGLNFLTAISMSDSDEMKLIKKILGLQINTLSVHGVVGTGGSASVEGLFEGAFKIAKGIEFTKTGLRLRIGGGNIQFSLLCSIDVQLDQLLRFTGEMTVQPNGASLAATMLGTWSKPFGISGVELSDVALSIGVNAALIPSLGIAGKAKIGSIDGELGLLFNSQAPQQSALHLAFNKIFISTLIDLCDSSIRKAIPSELDAILDSGFEDVDIHVVPVDTRIGEIEYQQGFRAKGKMEVINWTAQVNLYLDQSSGIEASGRLDSIRLLNIFVLQGAGSSPDPEFSLALTTKKQEVLIAGEVSFLGLTRYSIFAHVSSAGAVFFISQSLYGGLVKLDLSRCTINSHGFIATGRIKVKIGSIGPVKVKGVTLISKIDVNTGFEMSATLEITSKFSLSLKGSLEILGKKLPEISVKLSVAPSDFKAVAEQVIEEIGKALAKAFAEIWKTVEEWAKAVKDGVIQFSGEVASVAKNVYKASERACVEAYKTLGKGVNEIASGLNSVYKASDKVAAEALKQAGYAANEVAKGLDSAYRLGDKATAEVLKGVGYGAKEVAGAMKDVYRLGDKATATILKGVGYSVNGIGDAMKSVYKLGDKATAKVLKGVGYGAKEVAGALKDVYHLGDQATAAILKGVGFGINGIGDAMKSIYKLGDKATAKVLKGVGYGAKQIAGAMKDVYRLGDKAAAAVLKGMGYSVSAVGGAMKSVYSLSTKEAGKVMESVGYAGKQIKKWGGSAIDWIGGAGKTVVKTVKKIFKGW